MCTYTAACAHRIHVTRSHITRHTSHKMDQSLPPASSPCKRACVRAFYCARFSSRVFDCACLFFCLGLSPSLCLCEQKYEPSQIWTLIKKYARHCLLAPSNPRSRSLSLFLPPSCPSSAPPATPSLPLCLFVCVTSCVLMEVVQDAACDVWPLDS